MDWSDEISRAVDRNGVVSESRLERLMRQNVWNLSTRTPSGPNLCDETLDKFIAAYRESPDYADSFIEPPKPRTDPLKRVDVLNPTPEEFAQLAAEGKIRVG